MPAGGKVLQGIFKEMLDDYLKVAVKQASPAALDAVKAVSKTAGKDAAKSADTLVFKLSRRAMKDPDLRREYMRQLSRQVDGLKKLDLDDVLTRLDSNAARQGAQRQARERLRSVLTRTQQRTVLGLDADDVADQLRALGKSPVGDVAADADALVDARVDHFLSRVNALHEPDLVAGGADHIGSFGEAGVNQSLGSQWGNGLASQLKDYILGPPRQTSLDSLKVLLADR